VDHVVWGEFECDGGFVVKFDVFFAALELFAIDCGAARACFCDDWCDLDVCRALPRSKDKVCIWAADWIFGEFCGRWLRCFGGCIEWFDHDGVGCGCIGV